jgi:RimJ/RimL family protein N-acetyltransferase
MWAESPDKLCLLVGDEKEEGFIGDVNLHLSDEQVAEVDVMICDRNARRKGHATRALKLLFQLLLESQETIKIESFEVKIKLHNAPSIALFTSIGFVEECRSEMFKEVTMSASWKAIEQWTKN